MIKITSPHVPANQQSNASGALTLKLVQSGILGMNMMNNVILKFRNALIDRGIIPPTDLVADGAIHRCDVQGKNGKGDGAYLLHLNGIAAGGFINWRDGLGWQNWRTGHASVTKLEYELLIKQIETVRKQRELERSDRKKQAAEVASRLVENSVRADPLNRYIAKSKRVPPLGLRQSGDVLLVPLIDIDGNLVNIQKIWPDGTKRYLPGAEVSGAYSLLGNIVPSGCLYICEGWATAATIHLHTAYPVAAAMNCGNLPVVATAFRSRYPKLEIILAGDDDRLTTGNPGRTKAIEAAIKTQSKVVFPDFCRSDCACTDFNDLHCCRQVGCAA